MSRSKLSDARSIIHERMNGVLAEGILLARPGADLGEQRRNLERPPRLAVECAGDDVLQFAVADGVGFADEHWVALRQSVTPLDHPHEGVHGVVDVHEGLTDVGIGRIEVARRPFAVDALDLVGDRGRVAVLVVGAGDANDHLRARDVAMLVDHRFGPHLRRRVRPRLDDRVALVDLLAGFGGLVDQHRRREHELFDVERSQRFE
jgi:hypothetical protein